MITVMHIENTKARKDEVIDEEEREKDTYEGRV